MLDIPYKDETTRKSYTVRLIHSDIIAKLYSSGVQGKSSALG